MIAPRGEPVDRTTSVDPWLAAEQARQNMAGLVFAALVPQPRHRAPTGSLPLTVIGGFLGAGKTTLLSRLLRDPHGRRLAVLVNDFGTVNIDSALIASSSDDVIDLTNGCACCAVSADLTRSLVEIAQRDHPPDAIVLEASGIADPQGIAQIALANPAVQLDGVIVVVDAETVRERATDPRTRRLFHDQLLAADLVVLTKTDLLDGSARRSAREWIAGVRPDTPTIEAAHGNVPIDVMLGLDAPRRAGMEPSTPPEHSHDFTSVDYSTNRALDRGRLRAVLASLPPALLRAKGVLNLTDRPAHRTTYQRVGVRWEMTDGTPWGADERHSSLVFVGPSESIEEEDLRARLDACVERPSPSLG